MTASHKRPPLLPPVVALLAATLAWFAPALFFGQTLLSFDERPLAPPFVQDADPAAAPRAQNLITSDLQGWILAHTETAVARLKAGELPLWDSTELLGRPLHADGSFATFYAPDAIYLALPVVPAYAWSMAFHVFWAAFGMLLLLRRLDLDSRATLVGALAFGFSGWMLVHLHIPHFVRTAAWLPWLVVASWALARTPRAGRAALLALVLGMATLASYPPVLGVMLFGLAVVAAGLLVRSPARGRAFAWHVAAVAIGLGLGGVALAPMAELRERSLRAENVSEETARAKSLRPAHLISLAAPDFQGNPVALREAGYATVEEYPVARELFSVEVQDNYVENTLYGGVVALLLAGVALVAARRRAATWGFLALFLLGVLVASGSPLQWLFRDVLVPGLGSGSPKRVLLLSAFGLAGLAAIGTDELLRGRDSARVALACGALALAAMLAVGWAIGFDQLSWWAGGESAEDPRPRRILAAAFALPIVLALVAGALSFLFRDENLGLPIGAAGITLLLAGDLFVFGWRFNPFQPPEARGRRTAVVDFLTEPENAGRTARLRERNLLPASIVSQWGVRSVDGIQALLIREVAELLERWQPGSIDPANPNQVGSFRDPRRFALPIFDLLARWAVWNQPPPGELGFFQRYASEGEGLALSENPEALPDAFLADRVRIVLDREQRLAAVTAPDFAPARVAIVESRLDVGELPGDRFTDSSSLPLDPPPSATVASTRVDPETFRVRVDTPVAGVLVLNEAWFPGWHVHDGGERRAAIRVDHAFLGVPLAAGSHELEIRYEPASFAIGRAISVGSAALLLLCALVALLRPRAPAATPALEAEALQAR